MVNTKKLVDDLSVYGEIITIGYNGHSGFSYIVIMHDVTTTIDVLNAITTVELENDFPHVASDYLQGGVYKLERTQQQ